MRIVYTAILFLTIAFNLQSQDKTKILVFSISDVIDPRTNRQSELALEEAKEINADLVILELDTYGGAVTDADEIRTRILDFPKPVYVFINKDAASAGALISIACDSIYMAPGASIGAATVVTGEGQKAPDKYQSYMRSIMRSTAEATGRDPKIAEGMVDENLEVDTISPAGQVITFSSTEAKTYGFCDGIVESIEELIEEEAKIENYEIVNFELGATENIISIFLNPVVSGILILIILGGIYFELQTPGVGFPLIASVIALALYFVPYYLNGLAENWEIIIFVIGVALIFLEILVIPGFGVAGIAGIILSFSSLVLVMLNNDFFDFTFVPDKDIFLSISTLLAALTGSVILIIVGGVRLTNTKIFKRIALETVQDKMEGYQIRISSESLIGETGTTYTVLRPSGKIMVKGKMFDAYTRGDYIGKGEEVIVLEHVGNSLKVRKKTEA